MIEKPDDTTFDDAAEVYRQRYETFRHLDKVRWQMLQLLVAVTTSTALVLRVSDGKVEWWFYALLGYSLIGIAAVMFQIGSGIRSNGIVLQRAAVVVGDDGIPDVSDKWRAVSHWWAFAVLAVGGCLVFWSIKLGLS